MGEGIEKARPGRLRPQIKVLAPALVHILVLPILSAAIDGEFADKMHAAEEVIPRMQGGEFANPIFPAGNEFDFQTQLDRKLRKLFLRVAHPADVGVEIFDLHRPVGIAIAERRMVGAANLVEFALDGYPGILNGATGAVSQFGVHMVIDEHGKEV